MLQQSGEKDSEKSPEQKRQTEESQPVNLAHKLPEELEKALLNLPEAEKGRLIFATMREEQFQGPFPPPQYAVEYEKICPGFLARSLAMAEKAQAANIEIAGQKLENERLLLQINISKLKRKYSMTGKIAKTQNAGNIQVSLSSLP